MPTADKLAPEYGSFMGLFCGPRHAGKTCAECSFPGPILVLDVDRRINGLLGAKWIDEKARKTIEYESFPPKIGKGSENMKLMFERINARLDILTMELSKDPFRYRTVIVDSLTTLTMGMMTDVLPMTHAANQDGKNRGRFIAGMPVPGPDDYHYESQGVYQVLQYLRALKIQNIICSVHVIPTYGKEDDDNPMSETIVTGETFALRPKLQATVPLSFDHIFRFDKEFNGGKEKFTVQFRSDIANTSWPGLPYGKVDITGKSFYQTLTSYVKEEISQSAGSKT